MCSSTAIRRLFVVVVTLLVVLAGIPPAGAVTEQIFGRPDVSVNVQDDHFTAGTTAQLDVAVTTSTILTKGGGPVEIEAQVRTPRNVQITPRAASTHPFDFKSGSVVIGTLSDGSTAVASFTVEVPRDAAPGAYRIPVDISYQYTSKAEYELISSPPGYKDVSYSSASRRTEEFVTVVVETAPQFAVTTDDSSVLAGDTGRYVFAVENTGSDTAFDARVELSSEHPGLGFGGVANPTATTSVSLGTLRPGDATTVDVQMVADTEVVPGAYPVRAVVQYDNENGLASTSEALELTVPVSSGLSFELRDLSADSLRVGESNVVLSGQVVNTGSVLARNVVVSLATTGPISATGPESAVGDLAPGASAPVDFAVAVSDEAEPGTRQFVFTVTYDNADGEARTAPDSIRLSLGVAPERDPFAITAVESALTPGGTSELSVTVTNTDDDPVQNAVVKLFANDPLTAADDEAFVGTLAPGEEAVAVFVVSADSAAVVKSYPASVQVRYDDTAGDTQFTDEMTVGIDVVAATGGLPVGLIVGVLAVVLLAGGLYRWRRGRKTTATDPPTVPDISAEAESGSDGGTALSDPSPKTDGGRREE